MKYQAYSEKETRKDEHTLDAKDELMMERVQRAHFQYFLDYQCKETGLIHDRTRKSPATIAGVGFALTAYPIAVKRQWISRADAISYTLKVLRNLSTVPQSESATGSNGYRGFFYHFLDPETGVRAVSPKWWNSELSSIDTALLMAGIRFARNYYVRDNSSEAEIRKLADAIYDRVDWQWLMRENKLIGHGWSPESGLIKHDYHGYSEALLLYLLAIGSGTHALPPESWKALFNENQEATHYKQHYIAMPGTPLFCYQYPHCWVDFRGINDDINRRLGFDYFQNSVRASKAQHQYAIENPKGFKDYNALDWGLTACDGPGDGKKSWNGKEVEFRGYSERGCPAGFDDGTIAPTAAVSALPFLPEASIKTIRHWLENRPEIFSMHGFADAFNPTFDPLKPSGWVDEERLAIDQGPIVIMIENYRSGFPWWVMSGDAVIRRGLNRAGFRGGWLST